MNQLFRGLIVVLLLGLYVYTVYDAIVVAQCLGTKGCTDYSADSFSAGFSHAMSLIGGLVSALVISALAITPAGGNPGSRSFAVLRDNPRVSSVVTGLYLVAWFGTGAAAYVVGSMLYPSTVQPLTDLGQSWLGLALTSAYAYFGIAPAGGGGGGNG